jgi:hypothetical protein
MSGMDLPESNTQSFVIKIWLEETVEESGRALWRGHITHIPSGERSFIKDLREISSFISPYLEALGVKPSLRQKVRRWLK